MATTPYLVWPTQQQAASSPAVASDIAGFGFGGAPDQDQQADATAEAMAPLVSPGSFSASTAVARPRLRRSGSSGRQQQAAGGGGAAKKPPQRGLGVAELERLRCGGDPLRDLSVAAAAVPMGDAANVHGNSVLLRHHHHHLPPAFDAHTGASRYYSPLLVQPRPAPPAPPAPFCYVHSHSAGGRSIEPEQQYVDRWGRMGGFGPVGGGAGSVHQINQLPAPAPEHPSSQSTVWRPVSSSTSCLHTGHRCDLCSKTLRTLTERGSRAPSPAAAATSMPDYSIYDLAAAMAAARKDAVGEGFLARDQGKKDVREIEFFPTSTNHAAAGGGVRPDESEFATMRWTPFFSSSSSSSSSAGGCTAPLDLSLKL